MSTTTTMTTAELFARSALLNWDQAIGRATAYFDKLSDQDMFQNIAPGKNRVIYLLGHLAAVHDRMIPLLNIGERQFPRLDELFISNPDNLDATLPEARELKKAWKDINEYITNHLRDWSPEEWLERHTAVSKEDFEKEPHRNRFTLILSRARHVDYHLGQLILVKK